MASEAIEPDDAPTDTALARVATLVRHQYQQQAKVVALERDLKDAAAALRTTSEKDLPEAMAACGLSPPTHQTIAGLDVDLSEKYRCGQLEYPSTAKQRRSAEDDTPRARDPLAALSWLESEGHGDLEKRTITVTLPRDSEETARELMEMIRRHRAANEFEVLHRRVVWWNTLAKFASEQVEQGEDIPLDLLGVHRVIRAKVSRRKE
jgi:hypothetical protein